MNKYDITIESNTMKGNLAKIISSILDYTHWLELQQIIFSKPSNKFRWNDSTLNNPLEASKTAWPVAHKESIFLPEFPITTDLLRKEFVIEETIAKGAFGEVYKVKQIKEGKEYALKVLSKGQVRP
ncbi:putative serine/threonine-protein kinase [Operophtera brumata]|uniref:Putative serine/threonine-protein kinase n=1 Tax=Operophtera brumata TaxID=104452 RepID=A0A0L7KXE7_OPEBR|nr:putative serine/threonine-protein kinase [Operophtera brumata]